MLKTYKYELCPTEDQKVLLNKHFGSCRFIYNWALAEKQSDVNAAVNIKNFGYVKLTKSDEKLGAEDRISRVNKARSRNGVLEASTVDSENTAALLLQEQS